MRQFAAGIPLGNVISSPWFWAAVALGVRLAVFAVVYPNIDPDRINFMDDVEYHNYGRTWAATGVYGTIVDGQVVPTAFRPPLYPAYLAGLYWLFGPNARVAVLGQILMQAATCGLTLHLASRFAPHRAAVAGAITALDPIAITYAYFLFTDTLFALLVLCAAWIVLTWPMSKRAWCAAGFGLGLATLARSSGFTLLAALLLFLPKNGIRGWLTRTAVAVLTLVLVLLPWLARNRQLTGEYLLSTSDKMLVEYITPGGMGDEKERNQVERYLARWGRGILLNHAPTGSKVFARLTGIPVEILPTGIGSSYEPLLAPALWRVLQSKSPMEWAFIAYSVVWLVVTLPTALFGMVWALRQFDSARWYLIAVLALLVMITGLSPFGQARYRIHADPFYAILAAIGVEFAVQGWQSGWRPRLSFRRPARAEGN